MPYNDEEKDLLRHQLKSEEPIGVEKFYGVNTLLQKYDIIPMVKELGKGSFLGSGQYGVALRAVYQGHEVAVKVSEDINEIDNWKSIILAAQGMPPDLKKHLPKIYKLIKDTDDDYGTRVIVVMELLKPLPPELQKMVNSWAINQDIDRDPLSIQAPRGSNQAAIESMKDSEVLYAAFKSGLAGMFRSSIYKDMPDDILQKWFKVFLGFKPLSKNQNLETALQNTFLPIFLADCEKYYNTNHKSWSTTYSEFDPEYAKWLGKKIIEEMVNALRIHSAGGDFPTYSNTTRYIDIYRKIPEFTSLLKTLEYLKAKGVAWGDVHYANLMMRPATGDMVVIDVGLFESQWDMSGVK